MSMDESTFTAILLNEADNLKVSIELSNEFYLICFVLVVPVFLMKVLNEFKLQTSILSLSWIASFNTF